MKIVYICESHILFNDGSKITYDHEQDCCELNYADFQQLDSLARNYDYNFPLRFVPVPNCGFLFGDEKRLFFVPCYSEQNGYYTTEVDIYFNGEIVLKVEAEETIIDD